MKQIFIVGDIHGDFSVIFNHLYYSDLSNVVYIQVGDFGIGFNLNFERKNLKELNILLKEKNSDLYVIRGNHDDPHFFEESFNNSSYYKNSEYFTRIHLLTDYSVININDENWLFVGGAISIDRKRLIENLNWWSNECFFFNETKIKKLREISHVVTHTSPSFCYPTGFNQIVHDFAMNDKPLYDQLRYERDEVKQMHQILVKENRLKTWWYGHFHHTNVQQEGFTTFTLVGVNQIMKYEK